MLPLERMPAEKKRNITSLFFDLDGTFVTESNLSSESFLSLEKIKKHGVKTIAVQEDLRVGVILLQDGGQWILLLVRMVRSHTLRKSLLFIE